MVYGLHLYPNNNNKNFIIDTEGKIGINVDAPSYKLELPNASGNGAGKARAFAWVTYSDARVKRKINGLASSLGNRNYSVSS